MPETDSPCTTIKEREHLGMVSSWSALTSASSSSASSSPSSSSHHHRNGHRHSRRRGRSVSLLFLVTVLVSTASNSVCSSVQVVVASFSPSPTSNNGNGDARRGGLTTSGRATNPAFGGGSSTSSSTKKKSTTSKTNEQEQKSKAYIRLYEKSVPREEEEEEETVTNEIEKEETGTGTNESESPSSVAALESSSVENEERNKEIENSESPNEVEEEEQEEVQQSPSVSVSPSDRKTTKKTKLESQLMSKDAMYQNQIDALTEQASGDIHQLDTNLKLTRQELRDYQRNMTAQLTRAQVTASEKEHALFAEITTLLAQLEEEQQAVQASNDQNNRLQQERADLRQQLMDMQEQYSDEVHDLEDLYEVEQNARTGEQAEHVSELLQTEKQARGQVEAVERAAIDQVEHLRVEYTRLLLEKQEQMDSVQMTLSSVRQSLRDREDLIAEWAADRSSAKALTRQLWQLLKGRVMARARRIKSRLQLWFSDEAP